MATATKELTPEQAEIAQLNGRIAVQDERISDLAGYQTEARALRDSVASLTGQVEALAAERDAAVAEAAKATGRARDAAQSASRDETTVAAAKALADAMKALTG